MVRTPREEPFRPPTERRERCTHPAYDEATDTIRVLTYALSAYDKQLHEEHGMSAAEMVGEVGHCRTLMACAELEPPCFGDFPQIAPALHEAVLEYGARYKAEGGGWATKWPDAGGHSSAKVNRAMTCLLFCPRRTACFNVRFTPQGELDL
jgi:hypothetical protein